MRKKCGGQSEPRGSNRAWGTQAHLEMLLRLEGQADGYYPYHAARAERVYLQRRCEEMLKKK
ncbi:MAG TPA: hypothetical protein VK880_12385 [Anaerolineales bacterium]|nr:hypothetical protein [Anaerolineales bacterium]